MISEIALAMLAFGAILAFARLMRGPTLPDRVIAIDLIGVLIVCTLVVVASGRREGRCSSTSRFSSR